MFIVSSVPSFRNQNLCDNQDVWQPRRGRGPEEPQLHFREDECRDQRDHQSAAAYILGRGCVGQQGTCNKLYKPKSHAHAFFMNMLEQQETALLLECLHFLLWITAGSGICTSID